MATTCDAIYMQQRDWASCHNIIFDLKGYVTTLNDNLFLELSKETEREFIEGAGGELKSSHGQRPYMWALHSSSALICNVFEYWRSRPLAPLASACGSASDVKALKFEQVYGTSISKPHLDVTLTGDYAKTFAIEAKFVEPYRSKFQPFGFSSQKYFSEGLGRWAQQELPACEKLARQINEKKASFIRLGAPQLLTHILGLANQLGKNFTLLYLWYDWPSPEATAHREEVERFASHISGEVDFRSMTYNELFKRLQSVRGVSDDYLAYLGGRYFSA